MSGIVQERVTLRFVILLTLKSKSDIKIFLGVFTEKFLIFNLASLP
jgi:hypothetical protein